MGIRTYRFLIDKADGWNPVRFYRAIAEASQLTKAEFDETSRILTVEAAWDPEESVRLACKVSGAIFRVKMD